MLNMDAKIYNSYHSCRLMMRIMNVYGSKVEQFRDLRLMIDSLFRLAKWKTQIMTVFYFFFFGVPFAIQLFATDKLTILLLNLCCGIPQMIFFLNELFEMKLGCGHSK